MTSKTKGPLGVCVVGTGFMGHMHVSSYRQMAGKARMRALCDIRPELFKTFDPKNQLAHYTSFDAMLKDPAIDVVDICLPTYLHPNFVIKALKAGKHVVCEKPLALTSAQAREVAKVAAKSKGKLMIAQVIRFWPEYEVLTGFIKKKTMGQLRSLRLTRVSPYPTWSWQKWMNRPAKSGGALLDLHIHDVDYALSVLGKPKAIYAQALKGPAQGYDLVSADFRYANGVQVSLEGGWDYPAGFPFRMGFSARFSKGALEFDSARFSKLTAFPAKGKAFNPKVREVGGKATGGGNISSLGGYFLELEHFIACFRDNKGSSKVTPASAAAAVALVEMERKSIKSGQVVKL